MIQMNVVGDIAKINKQLERLPGLMQLSAFDAGLRPAARVVQRRLKSLTPRSSRTGSTKKWSKKTKAARSGELALHQTTAIKLLKPGSGTAMALIGYRWPSGNKGHFVLPMKKKTRKIVLWGKVTGREARKGEDIHKRAFDETKQQAASAFTSGVARDVDRKLARLPRG